jgi:pimeloyl-ACP methyl ester carboxylesterase
MQFVSTFTVALAFAAPMTTEAAQPVPAGIKNVVIVPDAFVDGSSWRLVHDILWLKGYKVSIVQPAHTTLDDDVAATRKVLFDQVGPVVLVGHGIGGSAISIAGGGDKVKALVYVAALQPEVGENARQLTSSIPPAANSLKTNWLGTSYFDPDRYHQDLAADLPQNRTNIMAASQVPITQATLNAASWGAAWRNKPSYAVVATEDRVLNPDLQRWMYKRAGAKVTEVNASHTVYISKPHEVADVIEQAALNVK